MDNGEIGAPGDSGQTVPCLVEVERKDEAGTEIVIIPNLLMEEMIVREMT